MNYVVLDYKIIKVVQLGLSNIKMLKFLDYNYFVGFKLLPEIVSSVNIMKIYFIIRCHRCALYEAWYIYIISTLDCYTELN
jgi:hypothetical protein